MIRFIEVTKEDIRNGDRGCSDSCAIARALRYEYKTSDVSVEVEYEPELHVGDDILEIASAEMVDDIDWFIRDFDHREEVKPFTIKVYEKAGA